MSKASRFWIASVLITAAGILLSSPALAAECAPSTAPNPAEALHRLYAAAMRIDRAAFVAELTPDFYAFDGGKRYSREAFGDLPQALHDKGETYIWNVTEPDTHISCDTAWVAYVNRGSITDESGTHPGSWLESADLVWQHGAWKIRFFQSTFIRPSS
jgi:hypothetical protein